MAFRRADLFVSYKKSSWPIARRLYNFPWTPIGVKAFCEVMEWYVIHSESLYIMRYGLHTKQTLSAWWEHLCRQTKAYFHSVELYIKCNVFLMFPTTKRTGKKEKKRKEKATRLVTMFESLRDSIYLGCTENRAVNENKYVSTLLWNAATKKNILERRLQD